MLYALVLLLLPLAAAHQYVTLPSLPSTTLFVEMPILMSHNSATGYYPQGNPLNALYQNQVASFTQQLNCGVRSFDLRICNVDGLGLVFRHGEIIISEVTFQDLIDETKYVGLVSGDALNVEEERSDEK